MPEILFASQPIYDCDGHIYAHELLYRHETGITAFEVGDSVATSEVLYNLCTGLLEYVEHIKLPVCVNVSTEFLLSGLFLPLAPEHVIVELVERIEPNDEIVAAIKRWVAKGFRFALDDFEFQDGWKPLLDLATIIKVDIERTPFDVAKQRYQELQHLDVLWLAERIEDETTLQQYQELGFDLFQGYFLARPTAVEGRRVPSAAATQLTLVINQLFAEDPELYEIVAALQTDPVLVVNLLRIANSPYYGLTRKIESLKEVVMLLGLEPLRKWVLLIVAVKGQAPEKTKLILTRAYMCSELARKKDPFNRLPGPAFLVGLLSGSEVLLGIEKQTFLADLNVSESVRSAVLNDEGELGKYLQAVQQFEYDLAMKKPLEGHGDLFDIYQQCHFLVDELLNNIVIE
ncbi:HDOD domain-containing protein [Pseudidiomarina gelatinasegens]|uniref:HDOD domain-containing protein n=1 Tax=Pseudidiomarina gelatinasegens TaxID=2487740 RepID=A0A451GEY2_9GAMM|nr:HDOD domain-containing protein [Pseudidiomarina gelatinasegens]RWU11673.1 HDOD domain-containing protein [Pseudidiomarina gelatinasegens]|tara:strand:+ start:273 stop:1478 length:1206 start_codon:yes stop_codon:yes gene_type:complete